MNIGGLQKLTLIDYPGKLACIVFLIGCNFRCGYCHNPELVSGKIERISEEFFFNFLKERQGLLRGVCITGGEPTIYRELPDFIKKIRKFGYLIKLDTNGTNSEMLRELIVEKLINYVAMDIKTPLIQVKYEQAVSVKVNLEDIKESIEIIKNSGIDYEFRTTVVPGIHTKKNIIQIAKEISPAKKYFLQNFRSEKVMDKSFKDIIPFSEKELMEIKKEISLFFDICEVR